MERIGITQIKYCKFIKKSDSVIQHNDIRVMDDFSHNAYVLAATMLGENIGNNLIPQRAACILCTSTGPYKSIIEFHATLNEKGYVGLNPSTFPNTMLAASLSRITIALKIKGPSAPIFLSHGALYHGFYYAYIQIKRRRCDSAIILYINENRHNFGILIESEEIIYKRNSKPRFFIEEKANKLEISQYKNNY